MEKKATIPRIPFYFVRHGQTDWNKMQQGLCSQDDIPLNDMGLQQASAVHNQLSFLGITKIYASPLMRAKQTAEIINIHLEVHLEFHEGLRSIVHETVEAAFVDILKPSHTMLIVSHGEVYRILLHLLNAQTSAAKAKNCGVYFFSPPDIHSDQWTVQALWKED